VPDLQGRAAVSRLQQVLDGGFTRASQVPPESLELASDFARYLTVLVAGFLERSIEELAMQCARKQSSERIQNYVGRQLDGLMNLKRERLLQLVGSFSKTWRDELEQNCVDDLIAVDSLYNNRNRIAHGDPVGVTIHTVREHYQAVSRIIRRVEAMFDP
jgi:hypothetical protein